MQVAREAINTMVEAALAFVDEVEDIEKVDEVELAEEAGILIETLRPTAAVELYTAMARHKRAVELIRKIVERLVVQALDGHSVVYGPNRYYVGKEKRREVIDGEALFAWLGEDLHRAVGYRNIRVTSVRGIAAERGDDVAAVEATFFEEKETGKVKVGSMPVEDGGEQ